MNAELIAVGTELLLGDTINTDAAAVARLLSELGINVYWQTVVGDNRARLEQAVQLARKWGEDPENAAEAGILHDITKKLVLSDQLILCQKYGIINDNAEEHNFKLLHAKTGAAVARAQFGVSDEVYNAIRWHTTGKPDMTLLEKIIYMADYIEPNRDFPGVEKLRELAYEDLDKAMALGLEMSLEDIRSYGQEPYKDTVQAYEWYSRLVSGR